VLQLKCNYRCFDFINPLSASVRYTPHEGDITCSCCGASYKKLIVLKMASVVLKEENICY